MKQKSNFNLRTLKT